MERNFAKRRLRVLVREILSQHARPETYYVIIARPEILKIDFTHLKSDFEKAIITFNQKHFRPH